MANEHPNQLWRTVRRHRPSNDHPTTAKPCISRQDVGSARPGKLILGDLTQRGRLITVYNNNYDPEAFQELFWERIFSLDPCCDTKSHDVSECADWRFGSMPETYVTPGQCSSQSPP